MGYGGSEGSLAFLSKQISPDPSQAQVDQEGHHDLPTIPSLAAIPGQICYLYVAIHLNPS